MSEKLKQTEPQNKKEIETLLKLLDITLDNLSIYLRSMPVEEAVEKQRDALLTIFNILSKHTRGEFLQWLQNIVPMPTEESERAQGYDIAFETYRKFSIDDAKLALSKNNFVDVHQIAIELFSVLVWLKPTETLLPYLAKKEEEKKTEENESEKKEFLKQLILRYYGIDETHSFIEISRMARQEDDWNQSRSMKLDPALDDILQNKDLTNLLLCRMLERNPYAFDLHRFTIHAYFPDYKYGQQYSAWIIY